MTDVPLITAVLSAAAAIAGAAIPTVSAMVQSLSVARRERHERHEADKRQACVELLQAVENLRAQVVSNHSYHGDEMGARLAQVRAYAAEGRVQALRISLMAPPGLALSAQELAAAATALEQAAEATTDVNAGVSRDLPSFVELQTRITAFTAEAVSDARSGRKAADVRPPRQVDGGGHGDAALADGQAN
jgi:DNA-binding MarR family transcriptional regulator